MENNVKIGMKVFEVSDWINPTREIVVSISNIDDVTRFWGKLFFSNKKAAEEKGELIKKLLIDWRLKHRIAL